MIVANVWVGTPPCDRVVSARFRSRCQLPAAAHHAAFERLPVEVREAAPGRFGPEPILPGPGFMTETRGVEEVKMTRTILALAAASSLTLSMALAQTPSTQPANPPPPAMAPDTGKSDKAAAPHMIAAQASDEWLASKFKGTEVIGADGTKIGSVDDLLFDRSGTIKAVVVGVGGFLGIGAKEVALAFKEFQVVPGKDGSADQLKLGMTKEQLTAAAEFKPYEPPRPTVSTAPGSSGGMTPRSPMAPSQR